MRGPFAYPRKRPCRCSSTASLGRLAAEQGVFECRQSLDRSWVVRAQRPRGESGIHLALRGTWPPRPEGTKLMDSRLLVEVAAAIREGSIEDRQALLVAVAGALATCAGPAPHAPTGGTQDTSAADDRLLAMPEVAAQLGIPTDRAYDLGRQGRLPVVTIGKYRRVRQSSVAAFLKTNETTGLNRPRYSYSPRKERRGRAANQ